jgi:hypothetical protein
LLIDNWRFSSCFRVHGRVFSGELTISQLLLRNEIRQLQGDFDLSGKNELHRAFFLRG